MSGLGDGEYCAAGEEPTACPEAPCRSGANLCSAVMYSPSLKAPSKTSPSHSAGNDSNHHRKGCAPGKAAHPSGSYAPHGKTQTEPCGSPAVVACDGLCGDCAHAPSTLPAAPLRTHGEVGRPWGGKEPARCARAGCGHFLTMHDEGGCALAECSCHEGVNPLAFRSPVTLTGGCHDEGCACGEVDGWAVARIAQALRRQAVTCWNKNRGDLAVGYEDAAARVEGLAASEVLP